MTRLNRPTEPSNKTDFGRNVPATADGVTNRRALRLLTDTDNVPPPKGSTRTSSKTNRRALRVLTNSNNVPLSRSSNGTKDKSSKTNKINSKSLPPPSFASVQKTDASVVGTWSSMVRATNIGSVYDQFPAYSCGGNNRSRTASVGSSAASHGRVSGLLSPAKTAFKDSTVVNGRASGLLTPKATFKESNVLAAGLLTPEATFKESTVVNDNVRAAGLLTPEITFERSAVVNGRASGLLTPEITFERSTVVNGRAFGLLSPEATLNERASGLLSPEATLNERASGLLSPEATLNERAFGLLSPETAFNVRASSLVSSESTSKWRSNPTDGTTAVLWQSNRLSSALSGAMAAIKASSATSSTVCPPLCSRENSIFDGRAVYTADGKTDPSSSSWAPKSELIDDPNHQRQHRGDSLFAFSPLSGFGTVATLDDADAGYSAPIDALAELLVNSTIRDTAFPSSLTLLDGQEDIVEGVEDNVHSTLSKSVPSAVEGGAAKNIQAEKQKERRRCFNCGGLDISEPTALSLREVRRATAVTRKGTLRRTAPTSNVAASSVTRRGTL